MRDPDLLDFAFGIGHMRQSATHLTADLLQAEERGGDLVSVLRNKLPELRDLHRNLSRIIAAAEKAIEEHAHA